LILEMRSTGKTYRDDHAVTLANRTAASEESDDEDDAADND